MGKLIVLEGVDGSGKSTQMQLLTNRLLQEGVPFRTLRFPQYDQPSSALIRMYLNGEFGQDPDAVNAYAASAFYAVDRYASYHKFWKDYYLDGGLLLADRYATSNAVHQAGKVPEAERRDFLRWLSDLEYGKLGLPEPDLVLYLNMPLALSLELMRGRARDTGGQADIHEKDAAYLERCHRMAAEAAAFYHWTVIDCARDGQIRPAGEIAEELYTHILNCMEGDK